MTTRGGQRKKELGCFAGSGVGEGRATEIQRGAARWLGVSRCAVTIGRMCYAKGQHWFLGEDEVVDRDTGVLVPGCVA